MNTLEKLYRNQSHKVTGFIFLITFFNIASWDIFLFFDNFLRYKINEIMDLDEKIMFRGLIFMNL